MKNSSIVMCHSNAGYLKAMQEEISINGFHQVKAIKKASTVFNYILRNKPEVAILDGDFDHNIIIDLIDTVRAKNIKTKFVLVFTKCRKEIMCLTKTLQIKGACCVSDTSAQLILCIKHTLKNQEYFSYKIETFFNAIKNEPIVQLETLTPLELKTLSLLGPYQETEKIAKILNVQTDKIERQLHSIMSKLKETNKEESLLRWATKNNKLITSLAIHKEQSLLVF